MSLMWRVVCIGALLAFGLSCSGGGNSPIIPGNPGDELGLTGTAQQSGREASSHVLWGFWQIIVDIQTINVEVVPIRGASFHMNVARIVDQSPIGLTYKVNSLNIPEKLLDVDLTITHPVPNSNLRGFDYEGFSSGRAIR